jgi:hypothetical protein
MAFKAHPPLGPKGRSILREPLPKGGEPDYTQAGEDLRTALDKLCKDAENAVGDGYNYIILTDKVSEDPSLGEGMGWA